MLTKEGLNRAAARIALMPFFPSSDPNARAVLIEELGSICLSDAHAQWLAIRMGQVFKKQWPGLGEMRALYCKRFKPVDGYEVASECFPDGFASEDELGQLQIKGLPAPIPALEMVPPRRQISESVELRQLVAEIAESVKMPEPRRPRTVQEIEADLYKPHPVPEPKKK